MLLGISSYTYPWAVGIRNYPQPTGPLTAAELIRRARAMELSLVQIADNLPLHTLAASERERLAALAKQHGVAVEVGTRGIEPEHLLTYLDICQQLDAKLLRTLLHSGSVRPNMETAKEHILQTLPKFEAAGVALAIENHDYYQAVQLAQLMQAIDHPLIGICLDTVNNFGALEGPDVVMEALAPYVLNLHIKDFAIERLDHQLGFAIQGTPAGQGRLDIPRILTKLQSLGRRFNVILEQWTPDQGSLAATLSLEDSWAEQSLDYLRRVMNDAATAGQ